VPEARVQILHLQTSHVQALQLHSGDGTEGYRGMLLWLGLTAGGLAVVGAAAWSPTHQRRQYVAFGVLSLAAVGFTGTLAMSQGGATLFEAYFGRIPPLLAVALTTLAGLVSLAFSRRAVGSRSTRRGAHAA